MPFSILRPALPMTTPRATINKATATVVPSTAFVQSATPFVTEGNNITVTFTRTGTPAVLAVAANFTYRIGGGASTCATGDITGGTGTFSSSFLAGSTTRVITVGTVVDGSTEGPETCEFAIVTCPGYQIGVKQTTTIQDSAPNPTLNPVQVHEFGRWTAPLAGASKLLFTGGVPTTIAFGGTVVGTAAHWEIDQANGTVRRSAVATPATGLEATYSWSACTASNGSGGSTAFALTINTIANAVSVSDFAELNAASQMSTLAYGDTVYLRSGEYNREQVTTSVTRTANMLDQTSRNAGNQGGIFTGTRTSGGSGYTTPGTYTNVALTTGGSGTGATADITVLGGTVTTVVIRSRGTNFKPTDTVTCAAGDIGGGGTGFLYTVNSCVGAWTLPSLLSAAQPSRGSNLATGGWVTFRPHPAVTNGPPLQTPVISLYFQIGRAHV